MSTDPINFKSIFILLIGICLMAVPSCLKETDDPVIIEEPIDNSDISEDFSTNSQQISIDDAVLIHFGKDSVTVENSFENKGVNIVKENGGVIITSVITGTEVNYVLSGMTSNGFVKFYSDYKFGLIFNGVSILNNHNAPAINIQSKKKVSVTLVDNTFNRLVDGGQYISGGAEDMKGAFFSEGQLVFGGKGSLWVYGSRKHAICSDDYIEIEEGTITVPRSIGDGIRANDYIEINGGTFDIKASNNGIDCDEGYVSIYGGNLKIAVPKDGSKAIKSFGNMTLSGGIISLTVSGNAYYSAADQEIKSAIGTKCGGNMIVSGNCSLTINSTGKGGKGISVDGSLVFNGGTTTVATTGKRYEYNNEEDASVNAIKSEKGLTINNGKIYCSSAYGHGINSNGTLIVNGGVTIAAGSSDGKKGIKCNNNPFSITGGTLIGIGAGSDTPTASTCTQYSVMYEAGFSAGSIVHIASSSGQEALTCKLPQSGSMMLFSSPDLLGDTDYTIYTGGSISGGTEFHGLYTGASYTKGNTAATFLTDLMVAVVKK